MMEHYMNSSPVKKVEQIIANVQAEKHGVKWKTHSAIRDYILACLMVENASRAGGLCNLTLNNFNEAVFVEDRNNYVAQV